MPFLKLTSSSYEALVEWHEEEVVDPGVFMGDTKEELMMGYQDSQRIHWAQRCFQTSFGTRTQFFPFLTPVDQHDERCNDGLIKIFFFISLVNIA